MLHGVVMRQTSMEFMSTGQLYVESNITFYSETCFR